MKIKIKTFNGELPSYLTVGKEYEIKWFEFDDNELPVIYDDNYDLRMLCTYECDYLNGGSWEVVE